MANPITPITTISSIVEDLAAIAAHLLRTDNPHSATKAQVGLGNADNTSDLDKPVSTATQTALDLKQSLSQKGIANGYAALGSNSLVPVAQLGSGTPAVNKYLNGAGQWEVPTVGGGGIGVLPFFNADGSQDDITLTTDVAVNSIQVTGSLILGQSCDIYQNSAGNYGWDDLLSFFTVRTSGGGSAVPVYETLWTDGSGLDYEGYTFSPTTRQHVHADYHVHHDVALAAVIYPHIHWMPITNSTGTVRWGFKFTVAKGHQQGASSVFADGTTVYVEQVVGSPKNREHHLAEVSLADAIPATNIEPDSVIKVIIFRDATHPNDTFPDKVHAWQADMHYQAGRLTTKNKAPNFYL